VIFRTKKKLKGVNSRVFQDLLLILPVHLFLYQQQTIKMAEATSPDDVHVDLMESEEEHRKYSFVFGDNTEGRYVAQVIRIHRAKSGEKTKKEFTIELPKANDQVDDVMLFLNNLVHGLRKFITKKESKGKNGEKYPVRVLFTIIAHMMNPKGEYYPNGHDKIVNIYLPSCARKMVSQDIQFDTTVYKDDGSIQWSNMERINILKTIFNKILIGEQKALLEGKLKAENSVMLEYKKVVSMCVEGSQVHVNALDSITAEASITMRIAATDKRKALPPIPK
jgi:hypothetical protein